MELVDVTFEGKNPLGRFGKRVDTRHPRHGGVRRPPNKGDIETKDAALGVPDLELASLADEDVVWLRHQPRLDLLQHVQRAIHRAGLLVADHVRHQRAVEICIPEQLQHRQHHANRALHIR